MIIWGWRVVRTVLGTGRFLCPQCGCDTDYRHLALRQWFTLFFIPVIPLAHKGRCVECVRCRTAFTERVLGSTTLELFEHHQGLATRAAVAHVLGAHEPALGEDLVLGVGLLVAAPGVRAGYDVTALEADLRAFADREVVARYLQPLAVEMTIEGREGLLRRLVELAGRLAGRGPGTTSALEHVGISLGLTPAHVAGVCGLAGRPAAASGGEQ